MKSILIAAVALLALAHGSYAQEATDLEKLSQFFEDMKIKMTHQVTEMMNNQDLAQQAQTFIEDKRTQLGPLVAQLQDQFRSVSENVQENIKPLAANVQAQAQPLFDNFQQQMDAILKKVMDQAQAIGN